MKKYCYFNGKILKKSQIQVNITDLALMRGYGVFDFFKTYNNLPFRINDYLARFKNSAKEMQLKTTVSEKEIVKIVNKLLAKNSIDKKKEGSIKHDFGVRLLLTGGYSDDAYAVIRPNFFILIEELPSYPTWHFTKGITLHLWEHQREMPIVKTINYLTAINLSSTRKKLQTQETLYYYNNKILECTRNNFFLFHNDVLVTSSENVLLGITRKTVIELASKNFKIEIRDIEMEEINKCTESFITGSTRGICPVVKIDKIKIGSGRVGKNTQILMDLFKLLTQ